MRIPRAVLTAAVALLLATLTFSTSPAGANSSSSGSSGEATYRLSITNTTSGQYLTPPNWAAHANNVRVFQQGRAASPGVEAVAERGGVPVLAAELQANIDDRGRGVSGVATGDLGPIEPGETRTATFSTNERRFSLVSMIICTNDGFGGIDSRWLPSRDGTSRTWNLRDYDAGTELNTENRADLVPAPFCNGEGGTGEDQPEIDGFGRINRHPSLRGVGDLPSSFDWRRGSVGTVTVTRVAPVANFGVQVENLTGGQYFTPVNFAAHGRDADVWSLGKAPSPGVAAVAELGGVGVLADELQAAIDDQGKGVSGVIDADAGPIAPGETRDYSFSTSERQLSLVSMIICTNDGFAGLDSKWLPTPGNSRTYYLQGYDAGAELNTENRADLVPAPFCNGPGGTGEDQPEIDGFNRINRHPTLRGVGDLPSSFDWRGPVLKVTVTNHG
jgi:hypothetical protein